MTIRKFFFILAIIIFPAWITRIRRKIFDNKLKKYIISMGVLFIIWLFFRGLKSFVGYRFFWYCYYIGLIFIPNFYYLCSNYISKKENKIRTIGSILISSILLLLVLTNEFHNFVFIIDMIDDNNDYDYTYNIGYYIVAIWIVLLFLISTIRILKQKHKKKKSKNDFWVFVPTIGYLIYTILYVKKMYFLERQIWPHLSDSYFLLC